MKREASFRVVNAKLYTKCLRLDAKPLHIEHIYIVYTPKSYDFSVRLFPYFISRWLFKLSSTLVNIYIPVIYFYFILLYLITCILIHYLIILAAASLLNPPMATLVVRGVLFCFIRLHGKQHLGGGAWFC